MTSEPRLRVSNSPTKPLMIWDGECLFCKMWIERWREMTAGKVDYATYQQAASQFPEIPLDQFKHAMAFIEPDGKTFFAAEAVYRSLRFQKALTSSSHAIAASAQALLGYSGEKMCGRRLTFGRGAGFCARWARFI